MKLVIVNGECGSLVFRNAFCLAEYYAEDRDWEIDGYETLAGLEEDWWMDLPVKPWQV